MTYARTLLLASIAAGALVATDMGAAAQSKNSKGVCVAKCRKSAQKESGPTKGAVLRRCIARCK